MPRNPKALAIERADKAEVNYRKGEEALALLLLRRKQSMLDMARAGFSIGQIGKHFNLSRGYVHKCVTEMEFLAELKAS